jgi:hypothetical protein
MGVFAEAKNADKQFWKTEISCGQWEGSACTHDGPCFLLFEGVGGEGFFIFPRVPNVFLTCSHHAPKGFSSF